MKSCKRIISLLLCACLIFAFAACSSDDSGSQTKSITIAYQGGIGYAPIHVMEAKKLIEENYDGQIEVKFQKLDSGSAINEGIIGETIDVGCMGFAPAISAVAAGIPCKIISGLCSQSHGLMTNKESIKTLKDITSSDKIALVKEGSFQHLLLAMAAEKELGDAHALDNNIQAMAHAEGMAALESGTVALHLTSSPFINQERESGKYNELNEIEAVWPKGNTFLVAVGSEKLKNDEKLFEAVSKALEQAIDFINNNLDETVQIESKYLALDEETTRKYLDDDACSFFGELKGAEDMYSFMYRAGFIENKISSVDEIKYENVTAK